MPLNLQKYKALKDKAEAARREGDKAEGQAEAAYAELKTKFGCTSLKKAKELLAKMQSEQSTDEANYNRKLKAFEEEFGAVLDD